MILGETILVTTAVVSGSVVFLFCLATSIEEVRRQRREKEEDAAIDAEMEDKP